MRQKLHFLNFWRVCAQWEIFLSFWHVYKFLGANYKFLAQILLFLVKNGLFRRKNYKFCAKNYILKFFGVSVHSGANIAKMFFWWKVRIKQNNTKNTGFWAPNFAQFLALFWNFIFAWTRCTLPLSNEVQHAKIESKLWELAGLKHKARHSYSWITRKVQKISLFLSAKFRVIFGQFLKFFFWTRISCVGGV